MSGLFTAAAHAPSSCLSSLHAGHPISRVATVRCGTAAADASSATAGVAVVCAGGSCVSVQPMPPWFTDAPYAASSGGGGAVGSAAEAGRGAAALRAALPLLPSHDADGSARTTTAALSPEQRVTLRTGAVTCLCVAALPGSAEAAVAVVGTTAGTVALLLLEGSRRLCTIAECALQEWSGGAITAADAVVDVAFSMDPAGRPEFVSAASAGCVVVVDVQLLYTADDSAAAAPAPHPNDGTVEERREAAAAATRGVEARAGPSAALRAKAVEALWRPGAGPVRRACSPPFSCAFVAADVVRLLAPQRRHAAVAMDVALVVVLSSGALHYIERVVEGGSVRLLADARDAGAAAAPSLQLLTDSRAVPHVVYRYRLARYHVQTCNGAADAAVTTVSDACLHFSERDAVCHVVLAGVQQVPKSKPAPPTAAASAGATLGQRIPGLAAAAAASAASSSAPSYRALGWWAVAHNAVLPRRTFDRAALERQVAGRLQHPHRDASAAALLSADTGSPFTVHVQSGAMALSGSGLAGAAAPPSSSAAAMAGGSAGLSTAGAAAAAAPVPLHVGFAAATVLSEVLVLAAGPELYAGDLREVPAQAATLPALRPLRSFGAVVEGVAPGPLAESRTLLIASGAHVTPVSLV